MVRLIGYIPLVNKVQKTSFFSTRDIFYHGVLTIQIKISFKTHPHLVNMVLFHHPRWGFTSEERSAPCPHAIPWPSYHGAHHLSWSPLGLKKTMESHMDATVLDGMDINVPFYTINLIMKYSHWCFL